MFVKSLILIWLSLYDPQQGGGTTVSVDMPTRTVAVSVTSTRIACLLSDGSVRVLEAASGVLSTKIESREGLAPPHLEGLAPPHLLAISPDGKTIALGGAREMVLGVGNLRLDGPVMRQGDPGPGPLLMAKREEADRVARYNVPHSEPIMNIRQGFPVPRGGSLSIWRTSNGQKIREKNNFPVPISGLAFDGSKINIVDMDLNVFQLDENLTKIYQTNTHEQNSFNRYPVPEIVFNQNANKILSLSSSPDGTINLVSCDLSTKRSNDTLRKSLTLPPWAAALSPDGRRFATSGPEWSLNVWDFDSGRILKSFKSLEDAKTDLLFLSFCSDSERLLTSSSNGMIRVIDTNSGKTLLIGLGPKRDVRAAMLKGDHLTIVSGGYRYNREGTKIEPVVISNLKLKAPPSP